MLSHLDLADSFRHLGEQVRVVRLHLRLDLVAVLLEEPASCVLGPFGRKRFLIVGRVCLAEGVLVDVAGVVVLRLRDYDRLLVPMVQVLLRHHVLMVVGTCLQNLNGFF